MPPVEGGNEGVLGLVDGCGAGFGQQAQPLVVGDRMRTVEYDKHAPEQPGMPDAKADPSSDWFSPTPGCEMKWHTHGSWKQKISWKRAPLGSVRHASTALRVT